jgi:hypothetical protein
MCKNVYTFFFKQNFKEKIPMKTYDNFTKRLKLIRQIRKGLNVAILLNAVLTIILLTL